MYTLDLRPHLRDVLLILADHAHPDGTGARPGVDVIAWKLDKDPRTIRRALRVLEDPDGCGSRPCPSGFIHPVRYRRGGHGRATEFFVRIPSCAARKAPLRDLQGTLFEGSGARLSDPEKGDIGDQQGGHNSVPPIPLEPPIEPSDATRLVAKARTIDPDALDIARELRASLEGRGRTYFARDWHLTSSAAIGAIIRSGVRPGEIRGALAWAFADRFWSTRVRHGHDLQQILPQFQLSRAGPATNGNGHTPYDHAAAIAFGGDLS